MQMGCRWDAAEGIGLCEMQMGCRWDAAEGGRPLRRPRRQAGMYVARMRVPPFGVACTPIAAGRWSLVGWLDVLLVKQDVGTYLDMGICMHAVP